MSNVPPTGGYEPDDPTQAQGPVGDPTAAMPAATPGAAGRHRSRTPTPRRRCRPRRRTQGSGGVPGWAVAIIGLLIVAVVLIILLVVNNGSSSDDTTTTTSSSTTSEVTTTTARETTTTERPTTTTERPTTTTAAPTHHDHHSTRDDHDRSALSPASNRTRNGPHPLGVRAVLVQLRRAAALGAAAHHSVSMKMHSPGHSSADSMTPSSSLSGMSARPSAPPGSEKTLSPSLT